MMGVPGTTAHFGFYLAPQFSMIAFSSAVETLSMANSLSGETLYSWTLVSSDGQPVSCSNGIVFQPRAAAGTRERFDAVFVCTGLEVQLIDDAPAMKWLNELASGRTVLGALCTGAWLLARAGVLDGYRATIHWESLAPAREQFPSIVFSAELFEVDGDRYTCAGGTATLDMMLWDVNRRFGSGLVRRISEHYLCERIRDRGDKQRAPLIRRICALQPKLAEAVSLMEANIQEPMPVDELSRHAGLSRRQLERLFQRYLDVSPRHYYSELRLQRARQLLLQTSMSMAEVARVCGFVSASHFSKRYRVRYALSPRDDRCRAAGMQPNPEREASSIAKSLRSELWTM